LWGGDTIGDSSYSVGVAGIGIHANGRWLFGGSYNEDTGVSHSSGTNIIQIALDLDNNKIYYGKNGSWTQSGVPASNTGGQALPSNLQGKSLIPAFRVCNGSGQYSILNFGQDSSFAGNKTAQGYTDSNGIGDFYYEPPTGYLALCTQNLDDPAVVPSEYFDVGTYTGTGVSNAISDLDFEPDSVWIKARSRAASHKWFSKLLTTGRCLETNTTGAEDNMSAFWTSFDSNGFTVTGTNGAVNESGQTYVYWAWKANGSDVLNENGTLDSQVSANQDAGFSIVSFTGTGANATVGHGLDDVPELVIVKNRSVGDSDWIVGTDTIGWGDYLVLNATQAEGANSEYFNNTAPTSSVFSVGVQYRINGNGNNIIAYCFHSVEGYSKVGSYTGNGSTDGTFVYTGFKPRYVMVKRTDAVDSWYIYDLDRDLDGNPNGPVLLADVSNLESNETRFDFLSNGFKLRSSGGSVNASGGTYIYLAFAETDFKHSNGR